MSNPPLDITSFGAISDGQFDNTPIINSALKVAKAQKQSLYFPRGTWGYFDCLYNDGVQMHGEGPASALYALNPLRSAIFLSGSEAKLCFVLLTGIKPTTRGTTRESCRVVALNAMSFGVYNTTIETCAGAGIRADKSSQGLIDKNQIKGTLADSIHITDNSHDITISGNTISSSGDDGIAVVSYRDQGGMVTNVRAIGNQVLNNIGGRNMSVVGGSRIYYENNFLSGNSNAAGLYLAQENSYQTFGCHEVSAIRNTITQCGNNSKGHYGVMLFSDGAEENSDIYLVKNVISQDGLGGIRVFGPGRNFVLEQNLIVASPPLQIKTSGTVVTPYTNGPVGIP